MAKKRVYIIEYHELSREHKDIVHEYFQDESYNNGYSTYVEVEDDVNPSTFEKMLLELGYKLGQTVLLRMSW